MTVELLGMSSDAPEAIVSVLRTLVPAALLGVPLAEILAEPAVTFSPAARTFSNCTLPAPALVMVLPAAVRLPVRATPVPEDDVIVVSLASTTGAEIVWLPAV